MGKTIKDKQVVSSAPKYIPIEDLIAYRNKGLTLQEIATLTGCSRQAVHERIQNANLNSLSNFSDNKDTVLEHKQREIVKSLTGEKINNMSGLQLITGAAILEDKIRTIRGQAGQIVEHRTIIADLREAQKRLQDAGIVIDIDTESA